MLNSKDGPMVCGFASICGQKIVAVYCSGPSFDLRLDFDNKHTLVVHCSSIDEPRDNYYTFGTPTGWFAVSSNGHLEIDACSSEPPNDTLKC